MPDVHLTDNGQKLRTFHHHTTPTPLLNTLMTVHVGDTLLYGCGTFRVIERVVDLQAHEVTLHLLRTV